jgi:hypothetical protein
MHHYFVMAPEEFHGKIPFPLVDLIKELERRDISKVQGIFRLNGSDTEIKILIAALDQGPIKDWSKYEDIHTISCALKRYFRAMADRESILTTELQDPVIAAMKIPDEARQRELLAKTIRMIPLVRRLSLAYLIRFLTGVAANQAENLMTPSNLAICFGPNLINQDQLALDDALADQHAINGACTLMIKEYATIFAGIDITEDMFCDKDDFDQFNLPPVNIRHVQNQIHRCQFRQGTVIRFVPLCRLVKKWAPPTRKPTAGTIDRMQSLERLERCELPT